MREVTILDKKHVVTIVVSGRSTNPQQTWARISEIVVREMAKAGATEFAAEITQEFLDHELFPSRPFVWRVVGTAQVSGLPG